MKQKNPIIDHNQSYWELACIQISSLGLPGILIGGELAKIYGAGTVIVSICVGNLLLWIIALSIISMTARDRNNAIENVRIYLGNNGSRIATFILIIAFLAWYLLELKAAASAINSFFEGNPKLQKNLSIRFGVFLGMFIALLSIGGIRLIKRTCLLSFPFLIAFLLYAFLISPHSIQLQGTWGISFNAVILIIAQNLAGMINLPTFFRHSRSRSHSFLALILITIFYSLFQILGIFIKINPHSTFFYGYNLISGQYGYFILAIFFVLLSTICINLVNIYFSSVAWELVFPHRWNPKEYAIVGLFGTSGYAFLQAFSPMLFLENVVINWIANLGIVLLLAFLVKIIAKHRPRPQEKLVSNFCWLIGCVTSFIILLQYRDNLPFALISGVSATVLIFLCILFVEESIWTIKKITKHRNL